MRNELRLLIAVILLLPIGLVAQTDQNNVLTDLRKLIEEVNALREENQYLKAQLLVLKSDIDSSKLDAATRISRLSTKVTAIESELNGLNQTADSLRQQLRREVDSLNMTTENLNQNLSKNQIDVTNRISDVDSVISKNALLGIIGLLLTLLISGGLFWFLRKRQETDKSDLVSQLSSAKAGIEESLVKEFGKQTELMEAQMSELSKASTLIAPGQSKEIDHSFALKLAGEINLITRNMKMMDQKTKGLKQLQASVGKLKDNLNAHGYEMPELLEKPFDIGLRVIVSASVPDETMENGSEVISKILIPQVNYNDKMIQAAQVEVTVGLMNK